MRWMWIDRIVAFEPEQRLAAIKNVSLAEEHLHDHFPAEGDRPAQPVMPMSLIVEGMAQTAGVLVGSVNRFREKVILAKVVVAELERDVFPGDVLRYDALIERLEASGASTVGTIERLAAPGADDAGGWETIGRVDLLFSHLDQNMAGTEFPEENFVFSDNFRTILRSAGLEALAEE